MRLRFEIEASHACSHLNLCAHFSVQSSNFFLCCSAVTHMEGMMQQSHMPVVTADLSAALDQGMLTEPFAVDASDHIEIRELLFGHSVVISSCKLLT